MIKLVYEPYYFDTYYQPVGVYYNPLPPVSDAPFQTSLVRNIAYKINEYFFRGLIYIQQILDLLLSTSPFLEQYGPILQELPKMYHLVKAFNEVTNEEETNIEVLDYHYDGPPPKLFI